MAIDSNYIVDADENGMMYGMTQHHGLQHQSSHSHNFIRSNYLDLVWYLYLPISYVQAPPPNTNEFPSYMLMDIDDVSYETLYNVQEFPSIGDPHSDMRLDIDGMSYEELLELSEWINDKSERGLSEDIIARHMQTKSYLLPENLGDQESDICIICQDEYKNKEEIGILQCGHEYHVECVKRWLHEKNVCPMCKSKGLTIE
ncbi:E3 ubiquitin-protein ligase MBR2-like [Vigna radiata var. radiata]|uniref:RING-type E3 ubiquitin transferase n=1 Tax=Vigna radiata var. radiata TaxID=3916 RepID=A0A1S3TAE8_VIGRR|nr:E3 ubiquitin-protein ligase MBR2-like [Vigna radiata var. radiata]